MKAFAYVYSRTKKHEYGKLSDLSDTNHPQALDRVRGFVQSSDGLEQPQWLMIKEGNSVLWGLGCMNDYLDEMYSYDEGFRPIRCFTGIVMTDYSGEALPYDIEFFRTVFRTVMGRVFDSSSQKQLVDTVVDIGTASSFIYPQPFDSKLNKDYHQCRVFSSTVNAESLVASCLSCPDDISIAINVARIESVTTPRFNPLLNAVMRDPMSEEITDISVKHLCSNCGKAVDDLYDGLCQECWEALHPHCSRCGKETSDLRVGLCENCYDKEHPRCAHCGMESHYLQDGLCPECWDKDNIFCTKCGRKMAFHTKHDVCEECARKKRIRTLCYYAAIILLTIAVLFVRNCKQPVIVLDPNTPEKVEPKPAQRSGIMQERGLSHGLDTGQYDASQGEQPQMRQQGENYEESSSWGYSNTDGGPVPDEPASGNDTVVIDGLEFI